MIVKKITSESVQLDAPAKINLFLEVLCKRPDNFHDINSLFQAISLSDRLTCTRTDKVGIELSLLNDSSLSVGDDNLIARAYRLMADTFDLPGGLKVELEKNIPMAAGLGGGSSDAASTIFAVDQLFELSLSTDEMMAVGAEIGSDIPFFFSSGQAIVRGRGEIISEVKIPDNYTLVLVNPGYAVSTPESYAALKRGLTKSKNPFNLAQCRSLDDLVLSLLQTGNDFEEVHLKFFPDLRRIKEGLSQLGARVVRLSGSGPTVYGLFTLAPDIKDIKSFDCERDWHVYTVTPITLRRRVTD